MFKPTYKITDYFIGLVEGIAKLQTKIEDSHIRFEQVLKLQKKARNKTAEASTTIEGNTLTSYQVNAISEHQSVQAEFSQKQEVMNYFTALNWIEKNQTKQITTDYMCQIHSIVCHQLIEESKLGKLKTKPNYVVNEKNIILYRPPLPEKTKKMLENLVSWLYRSTNRHPIIDSAIFHHQFLSIHPFSDGNGRSARLLAQWILYQRKFDANHIYYLDNYYANDRAKYYAKIEQVPDLDDDFSYWLDYIAAGVLSTLEEVYQEINNLQINPNKKIDISMKQRELLDYLRREGSLPTKDIQKELNINRARVNQLIAPLVDADIVGVLGKGRATKYYLI